MNVAHLAELGVTEGGQADLINEATGATVTAAVIADTLVQEGQIRVSTEDLATLGLADDADVLVRKTPPLQEKIRKVAEDANASLSRGAASLDKTVKKTADDVKAGAGKAAESIKKETKNASDTLEKAASKTAKGVRSAVRKVKGDDDL